MIRAIFLVLVLLVPPLYGASSSLRLNSIGYPSDRAKVASVIAAPPGSFTVRRAGTGTVAFSGMLSVSSVNPDTGESMRLADFTALTEEGLFYLDVPGLGVSVEFRVARDVYNSSFVLQMMALHGQRCGMGTSFAHGGQAYAHGACHLTGAHLDYVSGPGTLSGNGGWHDAGDYGRYTVNAAATLGMTLKAWEHFGSTLENLHWPIPESGGPLPDYLAEMKWELLWLSTMDDPYGDGRVCHKLTSTGFPGFVMPTGDTAPHYFVPWGSAATAGFAATLALAARVYAPYDPTLASSCLVAAQRSYDWLVANPADVLPDQSCCSTGSYSTSDADDRLWAAAEIWETTGDAAALADFEARAAAMTDKIERDWDWDHLGNLGMYTYLLSTRAGRDSAILADVRNDLIAAADTIVAASSAHGYGRGLASYYWGANGSVARLAMNLQVANRIAPDPRYLDTIVHQLSHLYGRNYYGRSWVTGEGISPPLFPHHRPSGADGITPPWPGLLVGGGHPGATDWRDEQASYTTNENAINWTGAMIYALAGFVVAAGAPCACGDCDLNGQHSTILDALAAAQIAVGIATPNTEQTMCCDPNASGVITITDALLMAQGAAGIAVSLGCP